MSDQPKILQQLDAEWVKSQHCAVCDATRQRVIHTSNRPDMVICDACQSVFVVERGNQTRLLYGRLPREMPQTQAFAFKTWHSVEDIRAMAEKERNLLFGATEALPPSDEPETPPQQFRYADLGNLPKPPRRLRETGELPDLDSLFKDID